MSRGSSKRRSTPKQDVVVPLSRRLRNPPPWFVGRSRELGLVHEAMRRGHLVVVWGPGGIGKTSLLLQAVFTAGRGAVDHAIALAVSEGDGSGEELAAELMAALSEAAGEARPPRGELAGPRFIAACIDLADRLGAIVVIDDAHHAVHGILPELFAATAAYARRCRFLVTSRIELDIRGADAQSVALGPMDERELIELARSWSRGLSERDARAAARDADGSPFWLKQRLAAGRTRSAAAGNLLLAGLSAEAAEWLALLARLEAPLAVSALDAAFTKARSLAEVAAELEARGLVEHTASGVRIHGGARGVMLRDSGAESTGPTDTALARSLARAGDRHPAALVEALRLSVGAGAITEAERLLTDHAGAILEGGLAPRLWQVLARGPEDRFVSVKLRAAVAIGGGQAVQWAARLSPPASPADRLDWSKALAYSGGLPGAADAARALAAEIEDTSPEIAFEAMFFATRCLVTLGRARAALDGVRRDLATAPEQRASLAVWEARAHALLGEDRRALDTADRLEAGSATFGESVRRDLDVQRAIVYLELGRVRRARAALERAGGDDGGSVELRGTQRRLVREAAMAIEMGELGVADSAVRSLAHHAAAGNAELGALLGLIELRVAAARGDGARAPAALAELKRHAAALASAYWDAWVPGASHLWSILTAAPYDGDTPPPPLGERELPLGRALARLHRVLSGSAGARSPRGAAAAEADADREAPERADAAVVFHIANSRESLVRGALASAREEARIAVAAAQSHGLILWGLEARLALADALVLEASSEADALARDIAAWAERAGAPRFLREAEFLRAAASRDPPLTVFAELARAGGAGVAAVRRSRALLGAREPIDASDRAVVEALERRMGIAHVRGGSAYRAGLTLDTRRVRATLPDGAEVELAGRPLSMKLLLALFERGGAASKAELVRAAWGRADYHPFRDDKRLQVAIGRLRTALGDDVTEPRVIVTTSDGYRFAPELPVHRL